MIQTFYFVRVWYVSVDGGEFSSRLFFQWRVLFGELFNHLLKSQSLVVLMLKHLLPSFPLRLCEVQVVCTRLSMNKVYFQAKRKKKKNSEVIYELFLILPLFSSYLLDQMKIPTRWSQEQMFSVVSDTVRIGRKLNQQESPPAWTQEAYRPPCSCSPDLPTRGWGGGGGHPIQVWGGTPIQSWWGIPPPNLTWYGVPPVPSWEGGTPHRPDIQSENITFPYPSDARGKNAIQMCMCIHW